jgi:multidrug efflux system membrane fusion protein
VVKPDLTAELRSIKVARAEGNDTIVSEGVKPGERVVTEGQLRLAQGIKVNPGKGGPTS